MNQKGAIGKDPCSTGGDVPDASHSHCRMMVALRLLALPCPIKEHRRMSIGFRESHVAPEALAMHRRETSSHHRVFSLISSWSHTRPCHWLVCLQLCTSRNGGNTIFSHHLLNNVDAGFALHVCVYFQFGCTIFLFVRGFEFLSHSLMKKVFKHTTPMLSDKDIN
jgi:hypothetical protein